LPGDKPFSRCYINDLAKIQALLNSDEAFRKDFIADPVGMLKKLHFPMSKDMRASLRAFSRQAGRQPDLVGVVKTVPN
jgi:hypothetical protein